MNYRLLTVLFLLSFYSCTSVSENPVSTQLLKNTDLSHSPDNVLPWVAINTPDYELGISNEFYRSGSQSIFITNSDSTNLKTGTWTQTYAGSIPKSSKRLSLRAFVKGENIRLTRPESNIYISIRVFPIVDGEGQIRSRFVTSQTFFLVAGTFDWQPLEITLPQIPEDAESIRVYLNMGPGTTGKVYFDDITLVASN